MEMTAQSIRDRAYAARVSLRKVLKRAKVAPSTFYRWESGDTNEMYSVTLAKISDALEAFEAERAV